MKAKKNVLVKGTVKLGKETKEELCKLNDLSLEKLNETLSYKAIVPSQDSAIGKELEADLEKVLNKVDKFLLKTVSKDDLPRLKTNAINAVFDNFLNRGVYSKTKMDSLKANETLKFPAKKDVSPESKDDEIIEW